MPNGLPGRGQRDHRYYYRKKGARDYISMKAPKDKKFKIKEMQVNKWINAGGAEDKAW